MPTIAPPQTITFVKPFADLRLEDIPSVGGKNASLGEMYRELGTAGIKVPDGFAITADAYRHFLETAVASFGAETREMRPTDHLRWLKARVDEFPEGHVLALVDGLIRKV